MRRLGVRIASAAALVALVLAGLFGLVTWRALESQEVAVLTTRAGDAAPRTTRVWVARHGDALWIEAATPDRAWYLDLLRDPRVRLEVGGRSVEGRAAPVPGGEGHREIRRLLREKYGWADAWVGLLQDTSRSVAVRVVAEP
jgi:hypothetical protein